MAVTGIMQEIRKNTSMVWELQQVKSTAHCVVQLVMAMLRIYPPLRRFWVEIQLKLRPSLLAQRKKKLSIGSECMQPAELKRRTAH